MPTYDWSKMSKIKPRLGLSWDQLHFPNLSYTCLDVSHFLGGRGNKVSSKPYVALKAFHIRLPNKDKCSYFRIECLYISELSPTFESNKWMKVRKVNIRKNAMKVVQSNYKIIYLDQLWAVFGTEFPLELRKFQD